MNRYLVEESHKLGLDVIDRCNLTVLLEPGQEDLVQFLAAHKASTSQGCLDLAKLVNIPVCFERPPDS